MTTPLGGGSWAGGWDEPGVLSIVLVEAGTPNAGLYVYSGPPALGNLIASIVANDGTDLFGNTTYAGFTSYIANGTALASTLAQIASGELNLGAGYQFAGTGGAGAGTILVTSAAGSGSSLLLSTGQDSTGDASALINMQSAHARGATATAGNVQLVTENTYILGHLLLLASGQTISSTTPAPITGLSANVAVGTYKVAGSLRVVAAASGTTQAFRIQFNGTTTVLSAMRVRTRTYHEAAGVTFNADTISALATSGADTGAIPNGNVYSVDFEGVFTVSTAGTFHVDGLQATSAADETFTVQADSWMELTPA